MFTGQASPGYILMPYCTAAAYAAAFQQPTHYDRTLASQVLVLRRSQSRNPLSADTLCMALRWRGEPMEMSLPILKHSMSLCRYLSVLGYLAVLVLLMSKSRTPCLSLLSAWRCITPAPAAQLRVGAS